MKEIIEVIENDKEKILKGSFGEICINKITHETEKIKINNEYIDIDKKIVSLIKILNEFGIKTIYSCEGEDNGFVIIDNSNCELNWDSNNLRINLKFKTPK